MSIRSGLVLALCMLAVGCGGSSKPTAQTSTTTTSATVATLPPTTAETTTTLGPQNVTVNGTQFAVFGSYTFNVNPASGVIADPGFTYIKMHITIQNLGARPVVFGLRYDVLARLRVSSLPADKRPQDKPGHEFGSCLRLPTPTDCGLPGSAIDMWNGSITPPDQLNPGQTVTYDDFETLQIPDSTSLTDVAGMMCYVNECVLF
ncbi:MAG: hypothetical protein QOH79_584 [Acidimicrobiaceae bacterium]